MTDRVTVTVIGDNHRVEVEILRHGGTRTKADVRRYAELCARQRPEGRAATTPRLPGS